MQNKFKKQMNILEEFCPHLSYNSFVKPDQSLLPRPGRGHRTRGDVLWE